MDINFSLHLPKIISALSLLILFPITLIVANWINNKLTPYCIKDELLEKDNIALGISFMAYNLAVTCVFIGAMLGPSTGLWQDLIAVGGYSFLGILMLNLARFVNDKLILYKFCNVVEIIEQRNFGTGVVQAGSYFASGCIIAASLHGEGGGVYTAVAFFFLAQIVLIVFSHIYNFVTPFDIHHEIEQGNNAAGLAFGGSLIAFGIILMNSVGGDFISWEYNLNLFFKNTILAFVLLPFIRVVLDKIIFSHTSLNEKILVDKNTSAGMLEFSVTVGFSIILFFII